METCYIYLHGFASSPQSAKAQALSDRFRERNLSLLIPDLNQGDFFNLTLSRQIQQVEQLFPAEQPITLIGSSFGGLTAAWLGDRHPQVQQLVLLAPAFQFLAHWLPRLGTEQLQRWQSDGFIPVYHYGAGHNLPLSYEFVTDAQSYDDRQIRRPVPTLILHGGRDEVVPIEASREFAAERAWVKLVELDDDHALGNTQPEIWRSIQGILR